MAELLLKPTPVRAVAYLFLLLILSFLHIATHSRALAYAITGLYFGALFLTVRTEAVTLNIPTVLAGRPVAATRRAREQMFQNTLEPKWRIGLAAWVLAAAFHITTLY